MAGHMDVNGVYLKLGKGDTKGAWWAQVESVDKVCFSSPGALKKTMLIYGQGGTR
jgi:hypothetical protein